MCGCFGWKFTFHPDSRCVLDLPHALVEASDANAAAVLLLVAGEGNDVLRREVTDLMGPEKEDRDSLLVSVLRLADSGGPVREALHLGEDQVS